MKAVFYGLRPAVVALVASAALSIFTAITLGGLSPHALLYFWTLPHISWRAILIGAIVFAVSRWRKSCIPSGSSASPARWDLSSTPRCP